MMPRFLNTIVEIADNGSNTDPNGGDPDARILGKPLEGATPDAEGKGIDMQGQGATGSALTQAELAEHKVNDYVSKFRAYKFPMHTDFMRKAQQVSVDTKEPEYYEIGEAVLECETRAEITGGTDVNLADALFKTDKKLFTESATILVEGVSGYAEDGETKDGTPLVLYVESAEKNGSITVNALNGKKGGEGNQTVPVIAAGTKLYIMAPALSESEVEVMPDSAYPRPTKCYLQKKVCAMTYTDLFARIDKKAKWSVQDLKDWVLAMFRKKCTRSILISKGSKFLKPGSKKTGTEYCYTQEGVLRQLRLGFQIGAQLCFEDLIGITSMLFTKYSTTDTMDVYCGTKFLENLLNIDFSKHPEVAFKRHEDGETKIKVTSFETNFGTLRFVHEYALDDLGYGECAIAFSMANAKRFYYQNGKTITIDHEKGQGGEVREAKSQYYIQDDCLKITDLNSMFIGPDVTLVSKAYGSLGVTIKSVTALPEGGTEGDMVYLTEAADKNSVGVYRWNGTTWVVYNGAVTA